MRVVFFLIKKFFQFNASMVLILTIKLCLIQEIATNLIFSCCQVWYYWSKKCVQTEKTIRQINSITKIKIRLITYFFYWKLYLLVCLFKLLQQIIIRRTLIRLHRSLKNLVINSQMLINTILKLSTETVNYR